QQFPHAPLPVRRPSIGRIPQTAYPVARMERSAIRERHPRMARLATGARRRYKPARNTPIETPGRMQMNRREILQNSAALAVAAAAGIRPGIAQSPIVIKFSHVVAVDAPKGKASEKFGELVERDRR